MGMNVKWGEKQKMYYVFSSPGKKRHYMPTKSIPSGVFTAP